MQKLNSIEIRVIGALIEKELTTPEYSPLTLNSLVNACNQKSSRFPVVSYDDQIVQESLEKLRSIKLVARVTGDNLRVPKYKQIFTDEFQLSKPETAVLTLLMLRGAQTPGEIKNRSGRMFEFENLQQVNDVLDQLMQRNEPLVKILPKEAGTKEARFIHLLSNEELLQAVEEKSDDDAWKVKLEEEVKLLKDEIEKLKDQFEKFKKQFE